MTLRVNIRLLGQRRLKRHVESAGRKLPVAMRQNLVDALELVASRAKREFQGERTRALYVPRGGRRVKRRKPRPITSPPNKLGVFEGTYRQSITWEISGSRRSLTAEIGPVGLIYPVVHEFGLGHMPKRQVMTPAIEAKKDQVFRKIGLSFKVL